MGCFLKNLKLNKQLLEKQTRLQEKQEQSIFKI